MVLVLSLALIKKQAIALALTLLSCVLNKSV